ncbi:uncharacterized protein ANIA_11296 [Aspergillus nidulans FGSC A4]|uniref:Uncharacterized protein n=1 Tax=Emericella nidulans (strain FGSC A4 / ATCC 38163 / CBS 112.46 / NRRL 194 / M139) TaxID=227321 RepID=C8VST9_EMENI|nr:hypothetical protein [Aspergillus nidulans FGSC A4]CBF87943.1 TPA: hypothetical protein ANIA_11296 [Aspergillus nidulans FGSC A4]
MRTWSINYLFAPGAEGSLDNSPAKVCQSASYEIQSLEKAFIRSATRAI